MQNNILELLETVRDGLEYAFTADEEAANSTLGDCLYAMNAMIETLEQSLKASRFAQYTNVISETCLAIESLLTDVDDIEIINDLADRIHKSLTQLSELLKTENEIAIEIVFFPYKASMWDSLESIWKAACDDEHCFVSVVPIPYYDKDPQENKMKLNYEGHLFPDYVTVIPYEDFDIELIKPDIAYIHNPYDNHNYVTSVHPAYYSRELKKHVKTLVYVPYFINNKPTSVTFAAAAAALSADLIIAASKEDAESYRRAGVRYEIAPLGSPKIDRIINMEDDKPEIPDQWHNLRGKKVFFLNTSINSMLRYRADYFDKILALISLFEGRTDAALLWRPHPLTLSTIDSMRPELRGAYLSLEEAVKKSNSAVIDLTPDMGVSMAISDAYIGDGVSSLVYLYALTGRPLYLINFRMPISPTEDELSELLTSDVLIQPCVDGEDVWSFCASVNALCKLDLETGRARFVSSVPGEDNRRLLYGKPVKNGDRLILPPWYAKEWAEYDTRCGEWKKYPIPDKALPLIPNGASFFTALDTEEFAIFSPGHSKAFVKYDKRSGKFEYFTNWFNNFEPHVYNMNYGHFSDVSEQIGNSLYFATRQSNIVIELDVGSMKAKLHFVGNKSNRYNGIAYDGNSFWLTKYMTPGTGQRQNAVVRWDKSTGECKEFPLEPVTYDPLLELSDFWGLTVIHGKVLVLPYGVNEVFQIDSETEEITLYETGLQYKLGNRKNPYYSYSYGVATGLFFDGGDSCRIAISYYDYSLLYFDAGESGVRKRKIVIEGIDHLLRDTDLMPPYVHAEGAFLTASDYISRVCGGAIAPYGVVQADYHRGINANSDGSCGVKVHEHVMRMAARKRGVHGLHGNS